MLSVIVLGYIRDEKDFPSLGLTFFFFSSSEILFNTYFSNTKKKKIR